MKPTTRKRKSDTRTRALECPRSFMDVGIKPLTPEMFVKLNEAPSRRVESLRDQLATIIQRNHVARTTSDQTARDIIALLCRLPPRSVFLGLD